MLEFAAWGDVKSSFLGCRKIVLCGIAVPFVLYRTAIGTVVIFASDRVCFYTTPMLSESKDGARENLHPIGPFYVKTN